MAFDAGVQLEMSRCFDGVYTMQSFIANQQYHMITQIGVKVEGYVRNFAPPH